MTRAPQAARATKRRDPPVWLRAAGGFALAGIVGGLLQWLLHEVVVGQLPGRSEAGRMVWYSAAANVGYGVLGMVGGALLGLALDDLRLLRRLALVGLIGFGVGGLFNLMLVFAIGLDASATIPAFSAGIRQGGLGTYLFVALLYGLAFAMRGAIGGAFLGLAVPHRHSVRILSLAGAVGFGAGGVLGFVLFTLPRAETLWPWLGSPVDHAIWIAVTAAVGGAVLGRVLAGLVRR